MKDIVIETKRLYMRKFRATDAAALVALNADPEVVRYTGDEPFESLEKASEFLRGYDPYSSEGFGRWAVIRKADDAFLGFCGLRCIEGGDIDVGYRFMQPYWGQGYATESARACLQYGFGTAGLKEIIGRVSPANIASIHVLEKLGMKYYKKDYCNGIEDSYYYKITKAEFEEF